MAFVGFRFSDTSLITALGAVEQRAQEAISAVVRRHALRAVGLIRGRTPVDSGRARRGWRIQTAGTGGTRGILTNDVPYITVLEFGGYPVTALSRTRRSGGFRRGAARLGGAPPGPKTQRAPAGQPGMRSNVSSQATRGMVRQTLTRIEPRFLADLNRAVTRAVNR